ncbi:MAG TPA: peptidoglycan-binding domain-containing protein, partial [Syntrophorhabdaceae bacterium]|nr:peptidoglycan-binding domain-containing protein [Syntrophorhabdaceae bacterium]
QRIYNDSNINVKYEGDLVKQVKRLQLANGIIPDGIVGTKTMMLLGGRISEKDPVLYSGKEGG